jgi:hypothetical protein
VYPPTPAAHSPLGGDTVHLDYGRIPPSMSLRLKEARDDWLPTTRAFADTTQVLVLPDMARDSRMIFGGGRNSIAVIGQIPRTSAVSAAGINLTRLNQATRLQRPLPVHALQCILLVTWAPITPTYFASHA